MTRAVNFAGRGARFYAALAGACLLLVCSAAALFAYRAQVARRGFIRTDRRVYAAPPAPPLPRAGGKFFDPVFGAEIMRVTDAATTGNRSAGTSYSYWPTFNRDNTRLFLLRDGATSGVVCEFDPVNFRLGASYEVPLVPNTSGAAVRGEDAIWSAADPDTLYAHTGSQLYAFNARAKTFKMIADLSRRLRRGESIYQMSKSESDDLFAFTLRGPGPAYAYLGYLVYRVAGGEVVSRDYGPIDECQLDKTGRYLVWKTGTQGVGKIEVKVVDLQTGAVTDIRDDAPDHAPGHSDNGRGTIVGAGNYLVGLSGRSLAAPRRFVTLLDLSAEKEYGAYHVSMLADDEAWALVSFHGGMANGVMQGEVVQAATDGSGRVRRLLHHRAEVREYYDQPRANISRNGQYVAFTSNWGAAGGRRDLFVARVEPAPRTRPRRVAVSQSAYPSAP